MSDFIREVDEEVRHDQFRRFLDRYWIILLVVVVLVLAAVGAWRANDYFTTRKAQTIGGQYLDALDLARTGKTAEANAALNAIAKDGTSGYQLLARFRLAADAGQTDAAAGARQFDALAADASVEPSLQNLARLRAALLLVDTAAYPDIKQRLDPLADANSGFRNSARELLALAALKAGKDDDASHALDAIEADPSASPALRQRADALLGLVRAGPGDKTVEPSPAMPAPAPAPVSAPSAPAAVAPAAPVPEAAPPQAAAPAAPVPAAAPQATVTPPTAPAPGPAPAVTPPPNDGAPK
jgi:hypothetical protein